MTFGQISTERFPDQPASLGKDFVEVV